MRRPGSGPIASDDEGSRKEWNQIRSTIVRPALAKAGVRAAATALPSAPTAGTGGVRGDGDSNPWPDSSNEGRAAVNRSGAKLAILYCVQQERRREACGPLHPERRGSGEDRSAASRPERPENRGQDTRRPARCAEEAQTGAQGGLGRNDETLEAEKTWLNAKILAAWGSWDEVSAALAKSGIEKDVVVKG